MDKSYFDYKYAFLFYNNGHSRGYENKVMVADHMSTINPLQSQNDIKPLAGFLTYDLKNSFEKLYSENRTNIDFSETLFIQPEKAHNFLSIEDILPENNYNTGLPKIEFKARLSKADYLEKIKSIQNLIIEGEVYEMNFCTEFYAENISIDPVHTFKRLIEVSPTPFSCLVKEDDKWLICASPERFLKRKTNKLTSEPIKGTARRHSDLKEDIRLRDELYNSEKERAENLMIVDLVRNDLSRICQTGSVKVEELFGIYSFKQVHQMISTISGELSEGISFKDIIKATFPMGSMTGAPKIRSMQLIEELEETKRGIFSGSVGYINENGDFDFNVVIRSLMYDASTKYLSYQVGSAITIDSDPEKEYEECMLKAEAILQLFS